jgi:enamine deaminase RidA (YjgF/YER057c/UK114 family)
MNIERLNPDSLSARPYYHQIVKSESRALVHISGQVAVDPASRIIGENDFSAQVDAAFANLDKALAAAGVGRADVVKGTTFIVDHDQTKWPIVKAAHSAFYEKEGPAWTVIGVASLAVPELLIEIEATAATD